MPKIVPAPVPLPRPSTANVGLSAEIVASGPPVHPVERVRLFSAEDWERFAEEWVDSFRDEYEMVERCGGAGDMGRDVIATVSRASGEWDNYQCKHYDKPLAPGDVWVELGKLAFYTLKGEYTYPRHYYFVAPRGVGTKLSNLLKKPEQLRDGLLANWDSSCRTSITKSEAVECDVMMQSHIQRLDFSIFRAKPVLRIIEEHARTRWHVGRFGGGLPIREPAPLPPKAPTAEESVFVGELRRAYAEHLRVDLEDIEDGLVARTDLADHFNDSRVEFYSAEGLRTFSRDTLPEGEFERLQEELHSGIKDEVRRHHSDGYCRILEVVKTARALQLTTNPLVSRIHIRDRGGMCHQLANDGKVRWVQE